MRTGERGIFDNGDGCIILAQHNFAKRVRRFKRTQILVWRVNLADRADGWHGGIGCFRTRRVIALAHAENGDKSDKPDGYDGDYDLILFGHAEDSRIALMV